MRSFLVSRVSYIRIWKKFPPSPFPSILFSLFFRRMSPASQQVCEISFLTGGTKVHNFKVPQFPQQQQTSRKFSSSLILFFSFFRSRAPMHNSWSLRIEGREEGGKKAKRKGSMRRGGGQICPDIDLSKKPDFFHS